MNIRYPKMNDVVQIRNILFMQESSKNQISVLTTHS
jgi:hypothetical protein